MFVFMGGLRGQMSPYQYQYGVVTGFDGEAIWFDSGNMYFELCMGLYILLWCVLT